MTQVGPVRPPPLLDVNRGAAAARVEQLPWVRSRPPSPSRGPTACASPSTEETPRLAVPEADGRWATAERRRTRPRRGVGPAGRLSARCRCPRRPGAPGTVLPTRDAGRPPRRLDPPAVVRRAGDGCDGRAGRLGPAGHDDPDRREHRLGDPARRPSTRTSPRSSRRDLAQRGRDRRQRPRAPTVTAG